MRGAQRRERVVGQRVRAPEDPAFAGRVVAQHQVQQRRLAGARGADDAERRAGRQREVDVLDREGPRRRGGTVGRRRRIRERHPVEADGAGGRLRQRAVIVDRQRSAQQRIEPRPRGLAALDQRQHPSGREHRPDELAQVHRERGQRADRQRRLPDEVAAHAQRQHGRQRQREAHRRLVRRLPALRVEARARRRFRAHRELARGAVLEPERAQRADGRHGLLHVLVQAREPVERLPPRVVHVPRDRPERPRHERERQQRDDAQPPVDAQRHHRDDEHERQRAVEAREERLARRHLHRVDVVGRERHQVARALAVEEGRPLHGEALVQPHAQLDTQPERRAEQRETPAHAQQVDRDAHRDQDRDLAPQCRACHRAGDEPVDDVADAPRDEHGQHRDAHEHQRGARVRAPVAPRETGDELQQRQGTGRMSDCARAGARAKKGQL